MSRGRKASTIRMDKEMGRYARRRLNPFLDRFNNKDWENGED